MESRSIAHRFYVRDTEAFDFVLGTDICKRGMSFMWTMVTDGNLYCWSSLSTRQAT